MLTDGQSEILSQARLLAAITVSCDNVGARINGTHLVAWCAQFFSRPEEQTKVLEFLQDFMSETTWPNQACINRLRRIWSGESKSWCDNS